MPLKETRERTQRQQQSIIWDNEVLSSKLTSKEVQ